MTEGLLRIKRRIIYIIKNPRRVFGRLLANNATLSRVLYQLYCLFPKLIYTTFCLLPIQKKKVVICNFTSLGGYGDNPKYLAQELLLNKYHVVWLVGNEHYNDTTFPPEIKKVKYGSINSLYELATANVWVDNQRKNSTIWKRNGQFYLQTWHGGYLLKNMSDGVENLVNPAQLDMIIHDCKMTDLVLSNSKTFSEAYRLGYHYSGDILEAGFPRNDIFFKKDSDIMSLKKEILLSLSPSLVSGKEEVKILMYAPTFRSTFQPDVYNLNVSASLKSLEKRFGGKWICLVRLHPIISIMSDSLEILNLENIYDVSDYPDAQELLCVSDVLITDYSSIIFDFTLKRKVGVLFTPDLETYKQPEEAGLAVDIESLPFLHANTNDELLEVLSTYNHEEYVARLNAFFKESGGCDNGTASLECVKRIRNHCNSI